MTLDTEPVLPREDAPKDPLSIREMAEEYRVSEWVIRRLIREGQLTATQVGSHWRIFRKDWQEYTQGKSTDSK